jgi:HEPN domain-containing protein
MAQHPPWTRTRPEHAAGMLTNVNLVDIAKCRFEEAKILLAAGKADGAVYLAGYAVELMLKRKIVQQLDWDGFPENKREFEGKTSFKVHDLSMLLHLSGLEKKLQANTTLYAKWQIASAWSSENRYREIGKITQQEAKDIINATREVLNFILKN